MCTKMCMVVDVFNVKATYLSVHTLRLKYSRLRLQVVEFSVFLLILAWALQQCSATALPVIQRVPVR